ncbi:MAG: diaminopimelate decarboxylase [Rhizonema sp. NSF051]|nr:diaminopimelate decarboxylase [Rhizonema sp. NSF051]
MNLSDSHVPSYWSASEQEVFRQWWWRREDLRYVEGHLFLGDQNLHSLAYSVGTPCYVYNSSRIKQNILRIHSALERASLRHRIFYAIKANRNPMLLTYIRSLGLTGVDCCSPNELLFGRQVGFLEEEISYTGVSVSNDDLAILTRHSGVFINCDSLSQIRRLGHLTPGREIGIRVNPNIGLSYNAASRLQYSGHKTTKFGIYKDSFLEALQLAAEYKLNVTGIHCHSGFGFLSKELPVLEMLLNEICWFVDQLKNPKYVNLGGGLGVPFVKDDCPLDLEAWARLIANYFAPKDLEVFVEPGCYIVKDSGVLLLQVTQIERKQDKIFVYVNGGHNINLSSMFYQLPLAVVPVVLQKQQDMNSRSNWIQVSIAGNINEAIDIFAEDIYLPSLQEGDYLAFLNAGGYGSSMSSNHCMRGHFMEFLIYPKE